MVLVPSTQHEHLFFPLSSQHQAAANAPIESTMKSMTDMKERLMIGGPEALVLPDLIVLGGLILLALELLNILVKFFGKRRKRIPVRGKHLDVLTCKDWVFIAISKLNIPPFVYLLMRYMWHEPRIVWTWQGACWQNLLLPLPIIFIVYDFFYTILHWALHIKEIYGFIHKHHHQQKAPSRANIDAVNVHPIEFLLGEYNHLLAVVLVCRVLNLQVHIFCVVLFLAIGGSLAGLNHTRFDFTMQVFGFTIYDSKVHDVHHRMPQCNYGQYIMLWDHIFGTFRPYLGDDRVNPKAQLDQRTGMSISYLEGLKNSQVAGKLK